MSIATLIKVNRQDRELRLFLIYHETIIGRETMKHLLTALIFLALPSAFAMNQANQNTSRSSDRAEVQANVCCSEAVDQRWCMKGCRVQEEKKIEMTTIEKIILVKPNGEEVESALCCSWTETNTNCFPTCLIEGGKMIPAAHLPPDPLPDEDFCRRFPGSNFCGGK